METICIVLDPEKMSNPDLDIRYILPDRVDEFTEGKAFDNGYDYLQDSRMVIWLDTEDSPKYAEYMLVYTKDHPLSELAESFRDYVKDSLEEGKDESSGPEGRKDEFSLPKDATFL